VSATAHGRPDPDWQAAGITHATTYQLIGHGLIERADLTTGAA
jgi:hypothetical protein